jgi:hypothetical protein
MTMNDWITRLDDFLKITDLDILTHSGRISRNAAAEKAAAQYEEYRRRIDEQRRAVDDHFDDALKRTKALEAARPKRKPKKS